MWQAFFSEVIPLFMSQTFPNIVYILADDMGYGDLSCLNPKSAWQTPNLDRLAKEGLTYQDGHSSSAVCTPSRYSVLTGRYNWRSWLKLGVVGGYSRPLIEPDRMTVASLLREQGYATACIGKWHLGWNWAKNGEGPQDVDYSADFKNGPCDVGFDEYFGICASLDMPPYTYIRNRNVEEIPDQDDPGCDDEKICWHESKRIWRPGVKAPGFRHEEVFPRCTDECLSYVERQAKEEKPFFVYYALPAPHTPILPTEQYQGASGTTSYGDFCLQVDGEVGRILRQLDELGIADNTLVIFTSDNGASPRADFAELAMFGHNPSHIYRGQKADIYEGGHRVPLLARWPRQIQAGSVTDETVCLVDLLATCAEIVGAKLPDDAGEDSISHLGLWRGEASEQPLREGTVHHSIDGSFSIRKGNWKLELCPSSGGWSYPHPTKDDLTGLPPFQLYDLEADVRERCNVAEEYPEVVDELKELLAGYVRNGRSTPGEPQENYRDDYEWKQLDWMIS